MLDCFDWDSVFEHGDVNACAVKWQEVFLDIMSQSCVPCPRLVTSKHFNHPHRDHYHVRSLITCPLMMS